MGSNKVRICKTLLTYRSNILSGFTSYVCPGLEVTRMVLTLSMNQDSQFQIVEMFGVPTVTDSGLLPLSVNGGTTAVLFVDVFNGGATAGTFVVAATSFCITTSTGTDCNTNVSFIYCC